MRVWLRIALRVGIGMALSGSAAGTVRATTLLQTDGRFVTIQS